MVSGTKIIRKSPSFIISKMKPRFLFEFINKRSPGGTSVITQCSCKWLIQPKVIPPFHGNKVSKPHVRKLMLNNDTKEGKLRHTHFFGLAHNSITVSNTSHVFHGSIFIIRTHHMVHLWERIPFAECFLVVIKRGFCNSKYKLMS